MAEAWQWYSAALVAPARPGALETNLAVGALDRAYGQLATGLQRLRVDATVLQRQGLEAGESALRRLAALRLGLALVSALLAAVFGLLVFGLGRRWDETDQKKKEITDQLKAAQQQARRSSSTAASCSPPRTTSCSPSTPRGRFRVANPRWRAPPASRRRRCGASACRTSASDQRNVWEQMLAAAQQKNRVPGSRRSWCARDGRNVMVEGPLAALRGGPAGRAARRDARRHPPAPRRGGGWSRARSATASCSRTARALICTLTWRGGSWPSTALGANQLGYTPEELLGRNLLDLLAPDVRGLFPRYLEGIRRSCLESGSRCGCSTGKGLSRSGCTATCCWRRRAPSCTSRLRHRRHRAEADRGRAGAERAEVPRPVRELTRPHPERQRRGALLST